MFPIIKNKGGEKMENKIPYERIPYISPDTLRKTLKLSNDVYDSHTKKNIDVIGSDHMRFSGTVENFGSEILAESRRLATSRPEILNDFYVSNNLEFFFDCEWSRLMPVYEQEQVIECKLKPNVLLNNKTYTLMFLDPEEVYVLRSQSTSDPDVHKQNFYYARGATQLKITDNDTGESEYIRLNVDNSVSHSKVLCFFRNSRNENKFNHNQEDDYLSVTVDKSDVGIPLLWIAYNDYAIEKHRLQLKENTDCINRPLLVAGTDGHGFNHLYPLIYGTGNLPKLVIMEEGEWYIKAITEESAEQFSTDINKYANFNMSIKYIEFVHAAGINTEPNFSQRIEIVNTTTGEDEPVRVTLNRNAEWQFRKPSLGDYNYNGLTYYNPPYAYIPIKQFLQNTQIGNKHIMKPAFDFSTGYSYTPGLGLRYVNYDSKSGIHIDASSDYTDHSVIKKNGIVHGLGEFDGLPSYFKYTLPRTIHRIHTELYTIKAKLSTQVTPMEKGTAGFILDTAIPNTEYDFILDDLNLSIKYNFEEGRKFDTVEEPNDIYNALSEIVFVDNGTFACASDVKYMLNQKFVYHGKRTFSLSKSGLDPDKEIGRVFSVSNDSIDYRNNDTIETGSDHYKPERTLARICDIPTSFLQLIQIKHKAPATILDKDYVRCTAPYTVSDKDSIWNNINRTFVTKDNVIIFDTNVDFNDVLDKTWVDKNYPYYTNLAGKWNPKNHDEYEYRITNPGSGYEVGDELAFMLGGEKLEFVVSQVITDDHIIHELSPKYLDFDFDISLFESETTVFNLESMTGKGSGAAISIVLTPEKIASLQRTENPCNRNLHALKFDDYNNIWVWTYDPDNGLWSEESQLTGKHITFNEYDRKETRTARSMKSVYLHNMLYNNSFDIDKLPVMTQSSMYKSAPDAKIDEIMGGTDLANNIKNMNKQRSLYAYGLDENGSPIMHYTDDHYSMDRPIYQLPRFHNLNLVTYENRSKLNGFKNREASQAVPYIWNPNKKHLDDLTYGEYCYGTDFKISNRIPNIVNNGVLTQNVYEYNEYELNDIMKSLRKNLEIAPRENLIKYLNDNYPGCLPLKYEGTDFKYSHDGLVNYIIQNSYSDPIYALNNIKLMRKKGDIVEVNGKPNGKHQTGWYEWLTNYHDPEKYMNDTPVRSDELMILKIDNTSVINLSSFIVKDELGRNISENCILIYGTHAFIYDNGQWVDIHNSTKEEMING